MLCGIITFFVLGFWPDIYIEHRLKGERVIAKKKKEKKIEVVNMTNFIYIRVHNKLLFLTAAISTSTYTRNAGK